MKSALDIEEIMIKEPAMTDRELLEAAAKAAGFAGFVGDDEGFYVYGNCQYACPNTVGDNHERDCQAPDCLEELPWNPLEDDGDAFRLAVKLEMKVYFPGEAYPWNKELAGYDSGDVCDEDECADPCAATRRAIVRAAAAMGVQQ